VAAVALSIAAVSVAAAALTGGASADTGASFTPESVTTAPPALTRDPRVSALARSVPVAVRIPVIGVSAPVMTVGMNADGTVQVPPLDDRNLTGWYEYGPAPGQNGPAVILGHVDSATGISVFFYLKDLRTGDRLYVTLADGRVAAFAVDGVQKVAKDAFPTAAVYGAADYPSLRLITCGGAFDEATRHYLDNIIVYAHMILG
jgi:LPXTG-site transpeptidase (sortase) family protein